MNRDRSGEFQNAHLSDDALLDRLYGLFEERASGHLDGCPECTRRWRDLQAQRAKIATPFDVSNEFLAAQRRSIYSRLGERPRVRAKWAPALAAAGLLAIVALVYHPQPAAPPHPASVGISETSDSELFSDAYSMEQSVEPRAAAPIHALFEAEQ